MKKKLRVLLVEPEYRRGKPRRFTEASSGAPTRRDDNALWYPPLGLMKLATFHKARGDEVHFVQGCDKSTFHRGDLFTPGERWDRVYITTLFTYSFDKIVRTITFYLEAVGGTVEKIRVGGIMASLMPNDIFEATGVYPTTGVLNSPSDLGLRGKTNIDLLPPDYSLLDARLYAINDTYYAYTTRGCTNKCPWCGVPKIEPEYIPYIDIKPAIKALRKQYGDKSTLILMDNNILASPFLAKIIDDLISLGYGRGSQTRIQPPKHRVVDFNQGLDATYVDKESMELLSRLNISPMRIAFDQAKETKQYLKAVRLAMKHGVEQFSNYMLYNFRDTPRDLFDRLEVNIRLNEKWLKQHGDLLTGKVFSYPMRFAPITNTDGQQENRRRDIIRLDPRRDRNWLEEPIWTKRFIRNIEIMKGASHGFISPVPELARRTIGETFEEFVLNLYMPEELLRYRDDHEKRQYEYHERQPRKRSKKRRTPTGKVEGFRTFMRGLLAKQNARFRLFHDAVSSNLVRDIREAMQNTNDREMKKWLDLYVAKR